MFKSIFSKIAFILISLAIVFVAYAKIKGVNSSLGIKPEKQVTIGRNLVKVEIADSLAKVEKGLSDRPFLAENAGMLFVFNQKATQYFWMKDMLIPLDFIWISDNKVVGVEKSVPLPPKVGTPPIYTSPEPINYVLEVNAGFADRHGIQKGTSFSVSLIPIINF